MLVSGRVYKAPFPYLDSPPPHRTELPGNILFALAYLARETYPDDKKKRMLTASQVTTLPSAKTWNQVFVQQKLRISADQRQVWDDRNHEWIG